MIRKIGFFLLAVVLGFFLVVSVVYCEHDFNKENQLVIDSSDDWYPSWMLDVN